MNACKKIFCLLLALVCCLGVFVGCKKDGDTQDTVEVMTKEPEGDNVDPKTSDDLDANYNFKKDAYTILSRKETDYEFKGDSESDATFLEQAVYDRNAYVEARCTVEIEVQTRMGNWWDRQIFITGVRNDMAAATSQYDLVAGHSAVLLSLALEGAGTDLTQLPNMNFTKRWWSEAYYKTANYNGAMYLALGDITYSLYEYTMVFFFNEGLAEDYKLGDMYELALDGDWNFEALQANTKMVTTNLDLLEEQQIFGFLANGHGLHSFVDSFGIDLIKLRGEDRIVDESLSLEQLDPMQKVFDFVTETEQVRADFEKDNSKDVHNKLFTNNQALFYQQMLGQAIAIKAAGMQNYGVLPYPKYDENQLQYYTTYCDDLTAIMIPVKVKDKTMAGTVTEMLCMESYRTVTAVYYEETLKYQAFDNPDCVETLEMIRTALTPSYATIFGGAFNSPPKSMLGNVVQYKVLDGKDEGFSHYWGENYGTWQGELSTMFDKLDALAEKNAQ